MSWRDLIEAALVMMRRMRARKVKSWVSLEWPLSVPARAFVKRALQAAFETIE